MAFSLNLQKACERGKRMAQYAADVTRNLLEEFSLKKLYPLSGYTRPDGTPGRRHSILPHQQKIHDGITPSGLKANRIVLSGGVGGGKTLCLCAQMLYYLKTYPGIQILVTAPFDYFFVMFILPKWREVLDDNDPFIASKNVKDRTYIMTNGSQITFHAFSDPDNIRGFEAHIVWIEEAAQMGFGNNEVGDALYVEFGNRLRAKPDHYPKIIYLTQNPSGHNYVWKRFIQSEPNAPQPLGDIGKITVWGKTKPDKNGLVRDLKYHEWEKVHDSGDVYYAVVCPSYANTNLDPRYIASMYGTMAQQPGLRERMIEGMWTQINSLVYEAPMFSPATHCIDYRRFLDCWEWDDLPPWNRVVVGIDVGGQKSPWAVEYYMEIKEDGYPVHWVCFDEIVQIGATWNQIADLILEKQAQYGFRSIQYYIDPVSGNHNSGPTQVNVIDEFRARGIHAAIPKGYNKYAGIGRVHSFMERDKKIPNPYIDDEQIIADDGTFEFSCGFARIYYLQGVPGMRTEFNNHAYACPVNIAEKGVYRYDNEKIREAKASEEGLSPMVSTKLIDRDDHTITAEFFAFLGSIAPLESTAGKKKSLNREAVRPTGMYGSHTKNRHL